ncbi:MAG: ribonuclease HII [Candidatus Jacksonbacteria bacterium RIFOXYC2_FULL_44_29]|nr:MAG: ribonuclease HII [Candidatus Jacksonbacteria bacterium RIFOXYA2_FULL_43_12]OGY75447.1 MAG: ribonuclease HII [Candidatus Jacksonbacteria bacterium RIFOXYB2_FULL_44_15]OGY78409.1 MAG: ribonuclease HII [Candidatus Jacksonbacteria bacterium RIFOXYC2_FULL_44_29]OGY80486.1 MAG: ribonuclease HII [Candidatus Jacksonbacteria bacterium RIFOXYD2_FULL_43_21]HBH46302.1 ribonuclease HII [Candidatus Jacksonbacteria bacterium]
MIVPTYDFEERLANRGFNLIAGVDEAGRGAWAGPIVAAAVILPKNILELKIPLRDSKLLNPSQRERIFSQIVAVAVGFSIKVIGHDYIDRNGLGPANREVILLAARTTFPKPDYLLIDNLTTPINSTIPHELIIKGDAKICSIAAASILAKVARDRIMHGFARTYPAYFFDQHKGYGTTLHQSSLLKLGPSPIHRLSYKPIKNLI